MAAKLGYQRVCGRPVLAMHVHEIALHKAPDSDVVPRPDDLVTALGQRPEGNDAAVPRVRENGVVERPDPHAYVLAAGGMLRDERAAGERGSVEGGAVGAGDNDTATRGKRGHRDRPARIWGRNDSGDEPTSLWVEATRICEHLDTAARRPHARDRRGTSGARQHRGD